MFIEETASLGWTGKGGLGSFNRILKTNAGEKTNCRLVFLDKNIIFDQKYQ